MKSGAIGGRGRYFLGMHIAHVLLGRVRGLRQFGNAPRHAPLDPPQGEQHRGFEPLRSQQAFGKVIQRAELHGAHGGELVAVFSNRNRWRKGGAAAELPQQFEAGSRRILGARAKSRDEQQQIAIVPGERCAGVGQLVGIEHAHGGLRAQHAEMTAQPFRVAGIPIDDEQAGMHGGAPRGHWS